MAQPASILIFSGKRKSGKDYVTELLKRRIGTDLCSILRLSAPLKEQYAKDHGLDFSRLLDASEYKEIYRQDMITWGEDQRNRDPGYFARIIAAGPGSERPVWIISDARRKSDVAHFQQTYPGRVTTVRVTAEEQVRKARGWTFTAGVDDAESECGLDSGISWDVVIVNNGTGEEAVSAQLDSIVQSVTQALS